MSCLEIESARENPVFDASKRIVAPLVNNNCVFRRQNQLVDTFGGLYKKHISENRLNSTVLNIQKLLDTYQAANTVANNIAISVAEDAADEAICEGSWNAASIAAWKAASNVLRKVIVEKD